MPTSVNPMLLTDEQFDHYRNVRDQEADLVAFSILNLLDHGQVYQVLGTIQKNTDHVNFDSIKTLGYKPDAPADQVEGFLTYVKGIVDKYFNDLKFFQFTPEEKACLAQASMFFNVHMTECTLALAMRSLLKQYAAYRSTYVLMFTQLLPKYPYRRILSTMQFVMDVMDVNAFKPDGYGMRSIQKLRLVHALIRSRIDLLEVQPVQGQTWNKEWGEPINQQDMLFAIHTFSVEVIKGLQASGEKISDAEIQNYYYAWHLIGRALGIKDELNPSDYKIGVQVQDRIYTNEFKPNPNGEKLAEPLLNFLVDVLPLAKKKGVLGLVKLFNDPKDYEPVFRNILGINLSEASKFYTSFYKTEDNIRHILMKIKYIFLPRAKRSDYFRNIARNQHKLFESIIGVAKTWSDNHFRIADAFGTQAAIANEIESKKRPMWKRALKYVFPKWDIT